MVYLSCRIYRNKLTIRTHCAIGLCQEQVHLWMQRGTHHQGVLELDASCCSCKGCRVVQDCTL